MKLSQEQLDTIDGLKFDEKGLIPCIVQDYQTRQVLILAYMNREAVELTMTTGKATFFSRSRQEMWVKGETSGNFLTPVRLYYDCDEDALLLDVIPAGPACHTGHTSCFYRMLWEEPEINTGNSEILTDIEKTVYDRKANPKEGSYTNYLLDQGIDKICKKVGEEATETVIAAKNGDPAEIAAEAGDLLYHLSVLLGCEEMNYADIYKVLQNRHGKKSEIKTLGKAKRGEI